MGVSDLAERIHVSHTFHSGVTSEQLQNVFFVMTKIKAQITERLVKDIDTLSESSQVGDIDLGAGF